MLILSKETGLIYVNSKWI